MRGKVHDVYRFLLDSGITPAYAGKSQLLSMLVCLAQGSPPPMRGKD